MHSTPHRIDFHQTQTNFSPQSNAHLHYRSLALVLLTVKPEFRILHRSVSCVLEWQRSAHQGGEIWKSNGCKLSTTSLGGFYSGEVNKENNYIEVEILMEKNFLLMILEVLFQLITETRQSSN